MDQHQSTGRQADPVAPLLEGTPYRLVTFLARGGMSDLWIVEHDFLGRKFALKLLQPHAREYADRLRVEAETLGRINHPNIVDVIDFWRAPDGRPCIVMELLRGRNLWQELLDRRQLPVQEATAIAFQALSALGAAHAQGIIHRDLKPENLFLHESPGQGRVLKVLDFGVARVVVEGTSRRFLAPLIPTATGARVGSPAFMSPEGARGERVDARSDLYVLGLNLYLMITGQLPFEVGNATVPPSALVGPAIAPAELDTVVLRAINEDPAQRFQSADEFLAALRPFTRSSQSGTTLGF